MLAKLFPLFACLLFCLGFHSEAKAQSGGSAFSSAVTAVAGNTNVTSTENITVTNVYLFNTATNLWEEVPAAQYAIVPGEPAKKPKINFINGLLNGVQYKVKYSWVSSQKPTVSVATS